MYHVSAQGVDERMINIHYYYYYSVMDISPTVSHTWYCWKHLTHSVLTHLTDSVSSTLPYWISPGFSESFQPSVLTHFTNSASSTLLYLNHLVLLTSLWPTTFPLPRSVCLTHMAQPLCLPELAHDVSAIELATGISAISVTFPSHLTD